MQNVCVLQCQGEHVVFLQRGARAERVWCIGDNQFVSSIVGLESEVFLQGCKRAVSDAWICCVRCSNAAREHTVATRQENTL